MKYVPGIGPANAKIMLIGEAAGAEEEAQGIPFVGPTGKLLTKSLEHAGIKREECYITNVVKVRPPGNNLKRLGELGLTEESYIADLQKEIEDVNPNIIIPVGNLSLHSVSDYTGITKYRGSVLLSKVFDNGKRYKIIPIVHPAICFKPYRKKNRADGTFSLFGGWVFIHFITQDLKKARTESAFPEIRQRDRTYIINPSFTEILQELDRLNREAEYLTIDLETFKYSDVIRCVGLGDSIDRAMCIPILNKFTPVWTHHEEIIIWEGIRKLLINPKIKKIAQNATFELAQLFRYAGSRMTIWMDTMRAHALLYPEFPHGLDFLTSIYTDISYYKDDAKGHDANVGDENLWLYNCKDVVAEHETAMELREELKETKLWDFYRFYDNPLMMALFGMEQLGVCADLEAKEKIKERLTTKINEVQKDLDVTIGHPLNINSPKQVKEYVYGELHLPKQYAKGSQSVTTNEEALKKLAKRYARPELTSILEVRGLGKLRSTYANMKLDKDNRIRTSFGIAETGRITSRITYRKTGMNLQNIPKKKDAGYRVRSMFVADPGKILSAGDLWQAQVFPVAFCSGDERMKDTLRQHIKVHLIVAKMIFNTDDPTDFQYGIAKVIVHGTNIKMGIGTFSAQTGLSYTESRRAQQEYFSLFPAIPGWHEEIANAVRYNPRTLISPMGRIRTFCNRGGDELVREAIAFMMQATEADYINEGLVKVNMALPEGAEVLLQVHDELILQHYPKQTEEVHYLLRKYIERPVYCNGDEFTIPLDIKCGLNWYDMREVK